MAGQHIALPYQLDGLQIAAFQDCGAGALHFIKARSRCRQPQAQFRGSHPRIA
jgi:hypothetical protein